MAKGSGKAAGGLMAAALKFLKRANKRNRPGRMTPHFRDHVFGGHVKPGMPKGSGYHYRPGGQDFPGRRLKPGTKVTDPRTGAYRAKPEFFDPTINPPHGAWKPKNGPNGGESSFYPDHWTPAQVDAAVPGAFNNASPVPGFPNKWRGTYNNVVIEGFYDGSGGFTHGWPIVP
ncbi:EndoU domain-containing protein [Actinomadura latina]|nr:EndoU domain-containing protein [Actinomadura latina]